MAGRLNGKTALVTAAGAGIGRACALAFAREGAKVLATDIDQVALGRLAKESALVETAVLDVTDDGAVAAAAARWPGIDVLLNAAGWVPDGSILQCDAAQWSRALDLNVTGMYRVTRAFLPAMRERQSGAIVNISSIASSIKGIPNRFAYGTTKAAVIGLTKSIAADFVKDGIRCNAICPGTIDTPSLAGRMAATGDPVAAREAFISRQPMGRLGTAEEVAALAVYLAGDEAAFTTGQTFVIDGGWVN